MCFFNHYSTPSAMDAKGEQSFIEMGAKKMAQSHLIAPRIESTIGSGAVLLAALRIGAGTPSEMG